MDSRGWSALDLMAGGMLAAGMAFGVYTIMRIDHDEEQRSAPGGHGSDVDGPMQPPTRQLGFRGLRAPSSGRFPGARQSIASRAGADSASGPLGDASDHELAAASGPWDGRRARRLMREFQAAPADHRTPSLLRRYLSLDRHRHGRIRMNLAGSNHATAEMLAEFRSYQETLDRWAIESENRIRDLEERNVALHNQLRSSRQAMQAERRMRVDAEYRVQVMENEKQTLEDKLSQAQAEENDENGDMDRLQRLMVDMRNQLALLQENGAGLVEAASQHLYQCDQDWLKGLKLAHSELDRQQVILQDLERDMDIFNADFKQSRMEKQQLEMKNQQLQDLIHSVRAAALRLVNAVLDKCQCQETDTTELQQMMDGGDNIVPDLDKLLDVICTLVIQLGREARQ